MGSNPNRETGGYCYKCGEPEQNPRNLPIALPQCPDHGVEMILRPLETQTREERFCGVWYDCPKGHCSILFQSAELGKFLMDMCTRKDCGLKNKEAGL